MGEVSVHDRYKKIIVRGDWIASEATMLIRQFRSITGKEPYALLMDIESYEALVANFKFRSGKYSDDAIHICQFEGVPVHFTSPGTPMQLSMGFNEALSMSYMKVNLDEIN